MIYDELSKPPPIIVIGASHHRVFNVLSSSSIVTSTADGIYPERMTLPFARTGPSKSNIALSVEYPFNLEGTLDVAPIWEKMRYFLPASFIPKLSHLALALGYTLPETLGVPYKSLDGRYESLYN